MRDSRNHAMDVVNLDHISYKPLLPEVKAAMIEAINKDYFKGLEFWKKLAGETAGKAWLVYGGDSRQIRSDVSVLPWYEINSEQIVI